VTHVVAHLEAKPACQAAIDNRGLTIPVISKQELFEMSHVSTFDGAYTDRQQWLAQLEGSIFYIPSLFTKQEKERMAHILDLHGASCIFRNETKARFSICT
jgi:hypothetical protein